MIEIKSRNILEVPKKTLIKNNVINKVNINANLLTEKLDTISTFKYLYNVNLLEYMKGKKQSSEEEIDGLGYYLGETDPTGFYNGDMSNFKNSAFNGKIINYSYEDYDICDVFKLAVVEEEYYNENGIKDIFDNVLPKLTSAVDTNLLYIDSLTYKTAESKTVTINYETKSDNVSPIYNNTDYYINGAIKIEDYDEDNFMILFDETYNDKVIDLTNSIEYRENFLNKGYQNVYIITSVNEGSCSMIHIFPCLYFPEKNTNKVALGSVYNSITYNNGEYQFAVVSSITDSMETNLISISTKTITYGSGINSFDLTTNELFQVEDITETPQYQPVLDRIFSKYVNGKETIDFKCALANYYDNLGVLKYDKSKGEYISNGEVIRIYISKRKEEILFSSKNFLVTSSRLTYSNGQSQIEIEAEETDRTE